MDTQIKWLAERLPPVEQIWRRSEPDFYGASYLIAQQVGKKKPPVCFATWRHGWVHLKSIIHPLMILGSTDETLNLVATENQVRIVREFGFKNAIAVGLPFIYGDTFEVERRPGSLVVMPGHTLPYTDHQLDEKRYVDQIAELKPHFSAIIACLHSSCIAKGYWVTEFERHGIPWISGADTYDKNALVRMNIIFKSFEYMTTNIIGSHIAYAAYSGSKPSIYGDYASPSEKDYQNDPFYKESPELLTFYVENSKQEVIEKQYPELFITPMTATERRDWGREVTGAKYKRTPYEIAELLGWSFKNQVKGYCKEGFRLLRNPVSLRNLLKRRQIAKIG